MTLVRVDSRFIPLDKSWTIRMGVRDLIDGSDTTVRLLRGKEELSGDLKSLLRASEDWRSGSQVIHVGESGTLYRFLRFASWKYSLNKIFIVEGTLAGRRMRMISDNPDIVKMGIPQLLKLDNGTSQWASAAVLLSDDVDQIRSHRTYQALPYKLELTYEAVREWEESKTMKEPWPIRYDETIRAQAEAFANRVDGMVIFVPRQPEDYCFARAFGLMERKEAASMWPSLMGHESNRLDSVDMAIRNLENHEVIDSKDHRVVQAVAMLAKARGIGVAFRYPESVGKSWPQFWEFLETYATFYG